MGVENCALTCSFSRLFSFSVRWEVCFLSGALAYAWCRDPWLWKTDILFRHVVSTFFVIVGAIIIIYRTIFRLIVVFEKAVEVRKTVFSSWCRSILDFLSLGSYFVRKLTAIQDIGFSWLIDYFLSERLFRSIRFFGLVFCFFLSFLGIFLNFCRG